MQFINTLLLFAPQEAYLCILVLAGFLVMIGFRSLGVGLFVMILVFAATGPFLEALIDKLPLWIVALLAVWLLLGIFKMLMGERVSAHIFAEIILDIIRAPFRILGWMLRRGR